MDDLLKIRLSTVLNLYLSKIPSVAGLAIDPAPPRAAYELEDYPGGYILTGRMVSPLLPHGNLITYTQAYVIRVLLNPLQTAEDIPSYGSSMVELGDIIKGEVLSILWNVPRLALPELGDLNGVRQMISVQTQGLVSRSAPGGTICGAIDFEVIYELSYRKDLP